jgi:hypothetical protein
LDAVGRDGFFNQPVVTTIYYLTAFVLIITAVSLILLRRRIPALLGPVGLLAIACLLSGIANSDLLPRMFGLLSFYMVSMAMIVIFNQYEGEKLKTRLEAACWIWLFLYPVLQYGTGWTENPNIAGIWPALGILVLLFRGRHWIYMIPFCLAVVIIGSRGVILGLATSMLVFYLPKVKRQHYLPLGIFFVIGLILLSFMRPNTVFFRFKNWQNSLSKMWTHNPVFGLGPGGVYERQVFLEQSGIPGHPPFLQPHSHNIVVHLTSEFGLVGLSALILSTGWFFWLKPRHGWQLIAWLGILVHSMVDCPFYFIGPVIIYSAIAATIQFKDYSIKKSFLLNYYTI